MRMKNKKWSLPFISNHPEIIISNFEDLKEDAFFKNREVYLEIGTGKGNFIVGMAMKNPKKFFIGIEKSVTCLAITAKKVNDAGLKNVHLILGDIANIYSYFPINKFKAIFLNFSDPWPKKRHFKRRLTYESFLKIYDEILCKNGKIIMKTDNLALFEFSQENFNDNGYEITYLTYQYDGSDKFDVETEYERYFRDEGTDIKRLIAKKVGKR